MNSSLALSSMFTDNMVLQQKCNIPIWGTGNEGDKVTVEFHGKKTSNTVLGGKWEVLLEPVDAGGPYEMNVFTGSESIIIQNVLVGEVWLAGGQSNMEMPLYLTSEGADEASTADLPYIRLFTVPRRPFEGAVIEGWHFERTISRDATWEECSPSVAAKFSAIAYYFAQNIYQKTNVPVGIISCNWGGTPAQVWMSEDYIQREPELKHYVDDYNQLIKGLDMKKYDKEFDIYLDKLHRQIENREKGIYQGLLPQPPMGSKSRLRPSGLYHAMFRKVVPYAVRGVIWYQGESNTSSLQEAYLYRKLFPVLIQNWRDDWREQELPFLFVQLSSFGASDGPDGVHWPILRESQLVTANSVKNTAMVVSLDCGEMHDIHPKTKKPVGERLAACAMKLAYGRDVLCSGPVYREMAVNGNRIRLFFDQVGAGLDAKNGELKGFTICGSDRRFVEAHSIIDKNTVLVGSNLVKSPVAVRYAWKNYPEATLFNKNGFPASSFRTDKYLVF